MAKRFKTNHSKCKNRARNSILKAFTKANINLNRTIGVGNQAQKVPDNVLRQPQAIPAAD